MFNLAGSQGSCHPAAWRPPHPPAGDAERGWCGGLIPVLPGCSVPDSCPELSCPGVI